MTWTAPQLDRTGPPTVADERTLLDAFLEFHRQTLLTKCAGLTAEQLKTPAVLPANLSLLGLVRHLTDVERVWFRVRATGEAVPMQYWSSPVPDADFVELADADAEANIAAYLAECEESRAVAARLALDDTFTHTRTGEVVSVRWMYIHLIEEYARHNGHADLLREAIDGVTGD